MASEWIELAIEDGSKMAAYVARASSGAGRGILVFQEAFGVNQHICSVADRFAQQGYVAIAPELYHRTGPGFKGSYGNFEAIRPHMQAITDQGLTADVTASFQWLRSEGGAQKIASIGYCMGDRVSFVTNAACPVDAAVSYYGGGIAPGLLDRASRLHAPMLFFWGGKDGHIGPDQIRAVEDKLIETGKTYVNVVFSDADHGFFCDERPSYHPQAAAQSWALTLAFLEPLMGGE